jgi:alkanesulfonate monooxygenase SsuD/methylene tetrahydromethanopterin reductase-like flavin-dependent oxidoreductase (luciferase family)
MLLRHTFIGETEKQIRQGAEDLSRFYCHFGAWFKNERPIEQGVIKPLSKQEMASIKMYSPENMRRNNVVGTPDEVIKRIKHYKALGYDEYSFWIDSGMTYQQKKDSLALFIREVMPAFEQ